MAPPNVEQLAREFASNLSTLLTKTICTGVKLRSVVGSRKTTVWVGYDISTNEPTSSTCFKVGRGKAATGLYMNLSYQLRTNSAGYLTVVSSFMGLFRDSDGERELLHIDYERDKQDGYPDAHIQVEAGSDDWSELLSQADDSEVRHRKLAHLHMPVGGRRFRPALEDLIEFVIAERFVEPAQGWEEVLSESRQTFWDIQLRAAVRANPDVAIDTLKQMDLYPG